MRYCFLIICMFACRSIAVARQSADSLLIKLIWQKASPGLKHILQHPDSFRYQIIYTQIDRDKHNVPSFTNHNYGVDDQLYFNPASTVKLPVALLALEKLRKLGIPGLNFDTPMLTDSVRKEQVQAHTDTTAENGLPSVAHYIKKIFLVSDNDAYNRLYEFVGQQAINEDLWKKGYRNVRIIRRFMPLTEEENRVTNPIRFVRNGQVIYQQPEMIDTITFDFSRQIFIGKGYWDKDEKLVFKPMDFTRHNIFPLTDLQHMLQSVLFPTSVPKAGRFLLTKEDLRLLWGYMSSYPSESKWPRYDTSEYYDSFTKFFFFKSGRQNIPPAIRVFNKAGWSYGFLTDAAYIVDFEHNIEFMLTGTVYVNRDGILNDNKYEYEEEGYPFFREIGEIIYQYELQRKRKYRPDLRSFNVHYREN
ncbi:hypothetical protein J2T02_000115 [Chitinophaga terrae (ex Kim and Jung 2007)]|uniref:serine hydrolase n=1 Tax=Chitinophaga terrae (ex Kim and Jung 2007) TaxID=408074 RepID=UPI00277FA515|nr:serine hydrolase [Chitinophaga terrae (ex Kim and Jung 2007)]MDQ0105032.1 hypothetical protein [Chitinophaga terrae (ex Kim and Jung 2007)]